MSDFIRSVDLAVVSLVPTVDCPEEELYKACFSYLKEGDYRFKTPNSDSSRKRLMFYCVNKTNKCKCLAQCHVELNRDLHAKTISPNFLFKYEHSELCIDKVEKENKQLSKQEIDSKAHFICKYFNYMTPFELKIYFGYDTETLKLIENRIKTIKKDYPYYSLETMLKVDQNGNRYHLISRHSDERIVCFSQSWSYELLMIADTIMIDGTWKFKIENYEQNFVINCAIGSNYFNCMFILLPDKCKETYIEMFNRIQKDGEYYHGKDFDLLKRKIHVVSDYEFNLINLGEVFTNFICSGCAYHLKSDNMKYLFANGLPKKKSIEKIHMNTSSKSKKKNKGITNEIQTTNQNDDKLKIILKDSENQLKRQCSTNTFEINEKVINYDIIGEEMKEIEEFDNFEESVTFTESKKNDPITVDIYISEINNKKDIKETNKIQSIELINKYYKKTDKILRPTCSYTCRELIKMLLNCIYLNSCFINNSLFDMLFEDMKTKIADEYLHILEKYIVYFQKIWLKQIGIEYWNVFNSFHTCNNISESINSKANWGIYKSSSISPPKFVYKVKTIFKETQQKIIQFNNNTLPKQEADHSAYKRCLIVMLNIAIFNNELDIYSYLYLIISINKIKNLQDRRNVFKKLLNKINSQETQLQRSLIILKNYSINNETFLVERIKFMNWIRNEIQNQSTIGLFVQKYYNQNEQGIIALKKNVIDLITTEIESIDNKEEKKQNEIKIITSNYFNSTQEYNCFCLFNQIETLKNITKHNNSPKNIPIEDTYKHVKLQRTPKMKQEKPKNQIRISTKDKISGIIYQSDNNVFEKQIKNETKSERTNEKYKKERNETIQKEFDERWIEKIQQEIKEIKLQVMQNAKQLETIQKQNEQIINELNMINKYRKENEND